MSDTHLWTCPEWSTTYLALVEAVRRGEDLLVPEEPMVFLPSEQVREDLTLTRADGVDPAA